LLIHDRIERLAPVQDDELALLRHLIGSGPDSSGENS
jgi:hypothetical protein